MATELAKAYVQIVPSAKGIKGSISEVLSGEASSAGNKAGNGIVSTIKKVIVAAGLGKVLKDTISEGANLEQSIGGVETLFKGSADTIKQYANEAYKSAGLSANAYMEQVTSFSASLLQSLDGDTAKAADSANSAVIDMADNANKMGTNIEDIQNAYQGFAKQNYTMLDNLKLGYGGTKTEMERLLADAEKISGVHYDISNLDDVYSAIHIIQGELGITGTTAEEAATTVSGSLASMKSAFSNVMGQLAIGGDVTSALKALGETVFTFVSGNLAPMVGRILSGLPQILESALSMIIRGINLVGSNADVIVQMGIDLVTGLAEAIVAALPYLLEAAVKLVIAFGNALINTDWKQVGTNLITNIKNSLKKASGEILGNDKSVVSDFVKSILTNLPKVVVAGASIVAKIVATIVDHLPEILEVGIKLIAKLAVGLISAIPQLVLAIPKIIIGIGSEFLKYDWASLGADIIAGIGRGILGALSIVIDAAKNAAKSIFDSVKEYFEIGSPSKLMRDEIGKWIPAGIAVGIEKYIDPVTAAMNYITKLTTGTLHSDIEYGLKENRSTLNRAVTTQGWKNTESDAIDYDKLGQTVAGALADAKLTIQVGRREAGRIVREVMA